VTKDWHQSVQAEEALAITHTKLAVITCGNRRNDPIVEWATVMAYTPEVRRILASRHKPPFIFLPSPPLDSRQIRPHDEALGIVTKDQGISNAQARQVALASILDHLASEGCRQELVDLAHAKSQRRAPGSGPSRKGARQEGLPTSSATAGLAACAETGFAHGTGPRPQDRCGVAGGQGTRRPMDAASGCVRREFSSRSSRDLVNDRGFY